MMTDGSQVLLVALLLIGVVSGLGYFAYANAVINGNKGKASISKSKSPPHKVAAYQIDGRVNPLPFYTWLDFAITALKMRWVGLTYEQAGKWIKDELEAYETVYPDRHFAWDKASAKEMANQIADDYGEEFGSNQ